MQLARRRRTNLKVSDPRVALDLVRKSQIKTMAPLSDGSSVHTVVEKKQTILCVFSELILACLLPSKVSY